MIENEDMAPEQPLVTHDDAAASPATIEVPAVPAVTAPPANPYINVDDLLALQLAGDPQFSPDGSLIAFTILQSKAETNTTSSSIWLVDSKAGKNQTPRQLTGVEPGKHHDVAPCWSPDSTEIAFCANRRPDPDLSVSMALWMLTLSTGQMLRLTSEEGLAQMPAWSPDGQTIAYYYSEDQTETSNVLPWVVNAHSNDAPRPAISSTHDFTCMEWIVDELHFTPLSRPQWFPDCQSLLIPVQERGQVHLYCADIEHDQVVKLTSGNGCYITPRLSKDGQTIVMIRTDWFTPGDIWHMDSTGDNRRKLTGVNDSLLRSRQLVRPKRITWRSFDGLEIEGWLYLPVLAGHAKAPLILEIHGGPLMGLGGTLIH